jgi:pyruvate/2-oxoglutarate dehydrogenase complex dihydrolipoamide acyltransferase (E2) component
MHISGEESNGNTELRGHVLLIAGEKVAHRRRRYGLDPSANLAAFAAVPTTVLLGSSRTMPCDLVHLDAGRDQNSLLLRLRAAAATPGPLLVYLAGQLAVDRRQRQMHMVLPGSTPASVRYTSLPWSWLRNELSARPAGTTTVLADLTADKTAWLELLQDPSQVGAGLTLFGVVTPPGTGDDGTVSPYTRQVIEQLRRYPDRPGNARLHSLAVAAADLPPGCLVLPPAAEIPSARSEDDGEEPLLRPRTGLQQLMAEAGIPYDAPAPPRTTPPAAAPPAPTAPAPVAPAPAVKAQPTTEVRTDDRGRWVLPSPQHQQHPADTAPPVRAPHPSATPSPAPAPVPAQAQPPAAPAPSVAQQSAGPAPQRERVPGVPDDQPDPRPIIWQTAQGGNHQLAGEMAAAWEQDSMRRYGPTSAEATYWAEIRADLARMAGNWAQAARLWIAAARSRLHHQAPDAKELLAAAEHAHYCWTQVTDVPAAREIGPELVSLLEQLPALDPRHVPAAQHRMAVLYATR